MASPGIKELGDQLIELTVKEVQELAQYLKETYGIEHSSVVQVPVIRTNVEDSEKTMFDIVLKSAGEQKLKVVMLVREQFGLGLKESKELVDSAPKVIREGLPKDEADNLKKLFIAAGADVDIR